MPASAVPMSVMAPAVSAQKPPTGRSLVMRIPIVFTIRQPPAIVPSASAAWRREDDPDGHVELAAEVAGGEQQHRDDPHRLLGVVGAVARGCRRRPRRAGRAGRSDRRVPGVWLRKTPTRSAPSSRSPTTRPISGASTMNMPILMSPLAIERAEPGLDQRRAGEAADERVRRGASAAPSHHVIRSHAIAPISAGQDHPLVDDVGVDDALAHRGRHAARRSRRRRRS